MYVMVVVYLMDLNLFWWSSFHYYNAGGQLIQKNDRIVVLKF